MFSGEVQENQKSALLFGVLMLAAVWYAPWVFANYQIVPIHDNLDIEVVANRVIRAWYRGEPGVQFLALNGHVPMWALPRASQPLSLLYAVFDSWHAYVIVDICVRTVALVGLFLLLERYAVPRAVSLLVAATFATAISYPIYGLTVAGLPLALYAIVEADRRRSLDRAAWCLIAFAVGSNISLPLSGVFFVALALPIVVLGLGERPGRAGLLCFGCVVGGIVAGNINILYAQFGSGIVWHRTEYGAFIAAGSSSWQQGREVIRGLLLADPWYHVATKLHLLAAVVLLVFLCSGHSRSSKAWFFMGGLLLFGALYVLAHTEVALAVKNASRILASLQWDRFYFLYPLFVFLGWMVLFIRARTWWRAALVAASALQLLYNGRTAPHLRAAASDAFGDRGVGRPPTFSQYYADEAYAVVKQVVGDGAVLSVGLDPMLAPMHGIASIDGYYVLYPLAYKRAFREVIRYTYGPAGRQAYYEKWGNRVYAFFPEGGANRLDFCAAKRLGAGFVLASVPLSVETLAEVAHTDSTREIRIYRIVADRCDDLSDAEGEGSP